MKEFTPGRSRAALATCFIIACITCHGQIVPGDARSAGLRYIVPDVALWFNTNGFVTNGFINVAQQANPADLGNWEPYQGLVGDSTFLIGINTYANDGTMANQNFAVAKQPADGGPALVGYEFYDDSRHPFSGAISLSRQNGNPERVAGDKRIGATTFITEAEVSIGQIAGFMSNNRWTNNDIYSGNNRYAAEQLFTLNTNTLVQTSVTNAWDYVYGSYIGVMGPNNNAPQCSRTGGRPDFLDNGNIVVMIDDKTSIASSSGEVTTFSIIKPDGTSVKGPTLVAPSAIFDNQCAFQGGFCIRVGADMYFYDNDGNLQHSNNLAQAIANLQAAPPNGYGFTGAYDEGRGDGQHIAADIRSPFVFLAGSVSVGTGSNACMMAIWNGQTGAFITNVMVSTDLDPGFLTVDRTGLAVNMSNQVCVAFDGQADRTAGFANQVIARVMQFDGTNTTYLCPSFFAFVNSDNVNSVATNGSPQGFLTQNPEVSMTTHAICISATGKINSTNNPFALPDSQAGNTAVYTVLSMPLGGPETVGLTFVVPDMACWWNTNRNVVTNGPVNIAQQASPESLGNWEPYSSVVGESTFLIEFNIYANDGTLANQNNVVALQPASGGAPALGYAYYDDSGAPFKGQINLSRQNGNPGRVAGDMRPGATNFITECEVSIGQIPQFQSANRGQTWTNNDIYQGSDRYAAEQIFSLNPNTLAQTPVTNAWDYVYGGFVGTMGTGNNAPQCSRTGGRPVFLDNGDIAVVIDDKTAIMNAGGEVTTFTIIKPNGALVAGPTLVAPRDIFDNVCAFKGGFAVRVHNLLFFFDNTGKALTNVDVNVSSGLTFGGGSDAGGRGDGIRIGGNVGSYYVCMAGGTTNPGPIMSVAVWDTRGFACVATAPVCELDPDYYKTDRAMVAVDSSDHFTVAYKLKPTSNFPQFQTMGRIGQVVGGTNIAWMGPSFYAFYNHDAYGGATTPAYETDEPTVAMTTQQICFAAKGVINSTNNPTAPPDTQPQTTVYSVIANPAASTAVIRPTVTATLSGGNMILTWDANAGLFTLISSSNVAAPVSSWAPVSPQPQTTGPVNGKYSMSVPIKPGDQFFELKR